MKKKESTRTAPALVGRKKELHQIEACLQAGKNVLVEGPVGVGKTQLALEVTKRMKLPVFRIDGDSRFTEQKLTGWFDPPIVMRKGYKKEAFIAGPLLSAMESGGVLFINELNRLPEGVQNVLLPAIDERILQIPKLGTFTAHPNFRVIATQNPKEFVATSHLSEAVLDRFELLILDYAAEEEEKQIVAARVSQNSTAQWLISHAVTLVRLTRSHERIRRGASIRCAMSIVEIARVLSEKQDKEEAFLFAALLALPTRIELDKLSESEKSYQQEIEDLIHELVAQVLSGSSRASEKKNTN